jgi:hypothetical protein
MHRVLIIAEYNKWFPVSSCHKLYWSPVLSEFPLTDLYVRPLIYPQTLPTLTLKIWPCVQDIQSWAITLDWTHHPGHNNNRKVRIISLMKWEKIYCSAVLIVDTVLIYFFLACSEIWSKSFCIVIFTGFKLNHFHQPEIHLCCLVSKWSLKQVTHKILSGWKCSQHFF